MTEWRQRCKAGLIQFIRQYSDVLRHSTSGFGRYCLLPTWGHEAPGRVHPIMYAYLPPLMVQQPSFRPVSPASTVASYRSELRHYTVPGRHEEGRQGRQSQLSQLTTSTQVTRRSCRRHRDGDSLDEIMQAFLSKQRQVLSQQQHFMSQMQRVRIMKLLWNASKEKQRGRRIGNCLKWLLQTSRKPFTDAG